MPSEPPRDEAPEAASGARNGEHAGIGAAPAGAAGDAAQVVSGRLHPATIPMALVDQVRWLFLPAIGALAFGGVATAFLTPLLVVAGLQFVFKGLLRFLTLTYRLDETELVIRDGVLARNERHIPVERIQDLQVQQNVVHRVLGVADVRVQTAGGGGEPDATLSVLGLDEVDRLRRAIASRAAAATPRRAASLAPGAAGAADVAGETDAAAPGATPPREVVRRLGVRDLALAGVTSSILAPLFAVLGSVMALADEVMPNWLAYREVGLRIYEEARRLAAGETLAAIAVAAAVVAAALLLGLVASAVWHVALFYDFTLSRAGESLERRYGLLTHRTISLPRRRIQLVKIEQSPLRRLAGLASLRADVAGAAGDEADSGGRDVMLPIARVDEAEALLPAFFPDAAEPPGEWRRVSRLAIRRGAVKGVVACLAATAAALLAQGAPAGLWPLAFAPLAVGASVLSYRNLGYALGERFLRTRRGWLGRSVHVVPVRNVQAVVVRQTPLDRRHGLATLAVDTAGQAFTGGGPAIPNLPLAEARALARELSRRAAYRQ